MRVPDLFQLAVVLQGGGANVSDLEELSLLVGGQAARVELGSLSGHVLTPEGRLQV